MNASFKGAIAVLILVASCLGFSQTAHASEQGEENEVSVRHNIDPSLLRVVDSSSHERFDHLSLNDLYEEIGSLIAQHKRICGEPQKGQNLADSESIIAAAWSLNSDPQDLGSQKYSQKYKEANRHYQIGGTCWTAYKQAFDAQVIYAERAHQQTMASASQNRKSTALR